MPAGPLEPGDPPALGAFELVRRLGEGGQGIVYEARSPAGERVAVKLLRGGADPGIRRRLARELESAQRVAPFCTARVLHAELDRPAPFVVSEFIDGPSLQDRLRDLGPLRGGDLERLAVNTAAALAAIHTAGVVHRDFKPANILLGPDGPRVVDFGIAQLADASTMPTSISGTPPYMAPEQLNGVHGSAAADVFSWAATMVYAATGEPPFGNDTVAAVFSRILTAPPRLDGVPSPLRETLTRCLAKDPESRPTAHDLFTLLVGTGPQTAVLRERKRHMGARLAAAGVGFAIAVTAGIVWTAVGGPSETGAQTDPATRAVEQDPATESGGQEDPATDSGGQESSAATADGQGGGRAAQGEGIPESFAGTWTGEVFRDDDRSNPTAVTLTLERGAQRGTWQRDDCEQAVQLSGTRQNGEILLMALVQRGQCVGGDITLTLIKPATLGFEGQEGGGSTGYQGTLGRS
ncbi:serine/threonine-protein kinase [Herbidospora mongoliensis]|uniref:serine/threonine-protein kinase n=1 Tax=Herbidospora mongoliensis TaxID=688067 RepID=UPI00082DCA59|nr:serine/threonine-protein kinase [Herbidospora mongoliensis]